MACSLCTLCGGWRTGADSASGGAIVGSCGAGVCVVSLSVIFYLSRWRGRRSEHRHRAGLSSAVEKNARVAPEKENRP